MDDPAPEDFERFLLNPWGETLFVELREGARVIGVAVTERRERRALRGSTPSSTPITPGGRSDASACSAQIELCRTLSYAYLYLGYWVDGCRKMQYKTDFRPQEHFDGHRWHETDVRERVAASAPPARRPAGRPHRAPA